MAKILITELEGSALNWAVAKCEGKNGVLHDDGITRCIVIAAASGVYKGTYQPSVNWSQGGPIIDRECIGCVPSQSEYDNEPGLRLENWCAKIWMRDKTEPIYGYGPTALVSAMRCFIASKSEEKWIEVPDELLEEPAAIERPKG